MIAASAHAPALAALTFVAPSGDWGMSAIPPLSGDKQTSDERAKTTRVVESRCGAVALGRTYLLPPLSSGGASMVPPWLRFHIPLIEPDRQISRIRLSDKTSRFRVQRHLQFIGVDRFPNLQVLHHVLRLS